MSKKNICASCVGVEVTKIIETDKTKIPRWLEKIDYVSNFVENVPLKLYKMDHPQIRLVLNVGKSRANKLILYWGAKSSNKITINDAYKAYGDFSNYGVSRVDEEGKAILYFNCPQPYSTIEKGKSSRETFYRHMHFCFSNKTKNNWLSKVYTKIVICNLKTNDMLEMHYKNNIVLLNTLPCNYYAKDHIPGSYNLHHKEINDKSKEELIQWMAELVENHYHKLNKLVKNGKISIYELPIVVYCGNKKCNLSEKAAIALYNKGFVNVRDYEDGMRGYNKFIKH